MNCENCKSIISDDEIFCHNCGTKVERKTNNKNNKKIFLIVIGLIIVLFAVLLVVFLTKKNNNSNNYGNTSKKEKISYSYSEGNIPKFIDGEFSSITINSSDDVLKALEDIKDEMKFKDISKELKLFSEEKYENITYYKFSQIYNDIPVYNQNLIVMVNDQGKIIGFSGYYIPDINISVKPEKTIDEIENIIKNNFGKNSNILSNELYIWAGYEKKSLVYVSVVISDKKAVELIIDAKSGEVLSETSIFDYSNTYSYTGMGLDNKSYTINLEEYSDLLSGGKTRYKFNDLERNIAIADYRFRGPLVSVITSATPGTNPIVVDIVDNKINVSLQDETFIQDAITAMANYKTIYDYYKNVLGRNSFDNKGSRIIVNLGVTSSTFSDDDLNNAMWCFLTNQMYIGNYNGKSFSASLDVLAHEFTHGVIQYTANFASLPKEEDKNKAFETGALNEGYSDILGSLIEGKNWTIAENNETLRSAINPNDYENPSVKGGLYYYPDSYLNGMSIEEYLEAKNFESIFDYDKGGVHLNSNVVSHAAYLMYNAGAFKDREEMAKVWYNSLFMLSSYSNFEDCALAVIKSAENLGLSDDSIYKITKAFQDTKMLESKNYSLKGVITSGEEKLKNINIEVYSYSDQSLKTSAKSNDNGEYELSLPTGTYKIKIDNEGFDEFNTIVTIKGETKLDIKLASKDKDEDEEKLNINCDTDNCYNLTIYFLEGNQSNELTENYETYLVEPGTILDANLIVDSINKQLNSNLLSYKDSSFYITISGFTVDFAWYYKDTDEKFDFNKPINQDIEIEMKVYDGMLDDDLFTDIDNWFKK